MKKKIFHYSLHTDKLLYDKKCRSALGTTKQAKPGAAALPAGPSSFLQRDAWDRRRAKKKSHTYTYSLQTLWVFLPPNIDVFSSPPALLYRFVRAAYENFSCGLLHVPNLSLHVTR